MTNIPTAHNSAKAGDFAKTVLMPGDPLRAKYIAETYLENPRQVNAVRNMFGYTGTYKGKEISVMGGGMGMPSIGIYSYELFNFYDVDQVIRIGSAGAFQDNIKLMDVVIGMGACTDSNYAYQYGLPGTFAPIADYELLNRAVETAKRQGTNVVVGNVLSSDVFYNAMSNVNDLWRDMGVLAVEMEAAALYMNAAKAGKKALCMLTISDHLYTGESLSAEDRQLGFGKMMESCTGTGIMNNKSYCSQVVSREVFCHEYGKIPRHTSQNAITEGDLECILTIDTVNKVNSIYDLTITGCVCIIIYSLDM